MESAATLTAFAGSRRLASGSHLDVALAVRAALQGGTPQPVLIFEDQTGSQVDFDLRGTDEDIAARLEPSQESKRSSGRPKLGVIAREVTLLPRHWEWLGDQPGGASVTLRKLVDAARKVETEHGSVRRAQRAADRFMSAMVGNEPGYEEASRALYSGDRLRFFELTDKWPTDLRDHARYLANPALSDR
jgi:uncharacterized protein